MRKILLILTALVLILTSCEHKDDFEQGFCSPPSIHLFSWMGEPLAEIKLPVNALLFDIDMENNVIFVVESDSEIILRYDLPDFRI